jgi:BASS family bile acid:Na+ symporter
MESIDSITLNFSQNNILALNLSLGFIMFGVALNLKSSDFKLVFSQPKSVFVGVFSQFFLLPFLTYLLVVALNPHPSFALGMILVAACPGGNISNFFSATARGNVALSVSLTAISSVLAIVMTPLNLSFWASIYPPTAALLKEISLDVSDVVVTIVTILGIPIVIGIWFRSRFETLALRIHPVMHWLSILIFGLIVVLAFRANFDLFINYIYLVVLLVLLHNGVALLSGYFIGRPFGLSEQDKRTIAIETGIQNSGLGLILIFAFFDGLGGMAIVAAWWGIWHIISGLALSYFWHFKMKHL